MEQSEKNQKSRALILTHAYDHSFPLRYKAPKENEIQVSLTQQVVIC